MLASSGRRRQGVGVYISRDTWHVIPRSTLGAQCGKLLHPHCTRVILWIPYGMAAFAVVTANATEN